MSADDLDIRHFTHDDLPRIRQTLIDVHAAAQGEEVMQGDDFKKRFPWFVDHWGGNPGFACVIAYAGDEAVGFAYGAPATHEREWWREHLQPAPERHRTFSYSELAVHPGWRKKGVADRLSRALMEGRSEDIAVLLVDVEHPRVQALYESWGYRKVGERRPFPDSPVYAVMITELPLS